MSMKVCVIGLGQVGLPTAKYILSKGFELWAYDVSPNAVLRAKERGIDKATNNWSEIPDVEVYVICVSTMLKGGSPDLSSIFDACKKIAEKNYLQSLISIESTIIPGTSKKIYKEVFNGKVYLVRG